MRILVINGPNLNMLGQREVEVYNTMSYQTLEHKIQEHAKNHGVDVEIRQSNLEGIIIDLLHYAQFEKFDGVILNAAAYTHYSYAIYDAIKAISIPVVEVHLTNPKTREEPFRHISVIENACVKTFQGNHIQSYFDAINYFKDSDNSS